MITIKRLYSLLAILIVFTINICAQSGWVQQNSGTTSNITGITFVDYNTGFALAGQILKTTNTGINWTPLPGNPTVASMCWPDANTGYISNSTVYKTTDGGLNWINLNQSYMGRISFPNTTTGFAICAPEWVPAEEITYYRVKRTNNGGINWNVCLEFSSSNTALLSYGFYYVQAHTPQVVYVAVRRDNYEFHGYWSRVYRTQNGGDSWDYVMHSADTLVFQSFHFPSPDTGYVVAPLQPATSTNFIYKYENFTSRLLLTTSQVNGIYFPNNTTGYIATGVNNMYKTTNGGNNWFAIDSPGSNQIYGFTFIDALTGYAVGTNGFIAKTTTGGESQRSISGTVRYQDNNDPVTSGYVKAIRYDSSTYNIITVDSAQIQLNGTYILQNCPPITLDIMAYENDEDELNFVPTYYVSTIYWQYATHVRPDSNLTNINIAVKRTSNGGDHFSISGYVYSNEPLDNTALKGAVIYARSGGIFKGHSISQSNGYYKIDSLPASVYELIADRMGFETSSYVVSITNSNLTNVNFYLHNILLPVTNEELSVPNKYLLEQNYPNPFNPVTKIEFSIPKSSFVTLTIYDLLGREILRFVNEQLQCGTYSAKWNAEKYPSGIYFYKIIAGDFTESKKMILIK